MRRTSPWSTNFSYFSRHDGRDSVQTLEWTPATILGANQVFTKPADACSCGLEILKERALFCTVGGSAVARKPILDDGGRDKKKARRTRCKTFGQDSGHATQS